MKLTKLVTGLISIELYFFLLFLFFRHGNKPITILMTLKCNVQITCLSEFSM
jgi:hypothetical protein